MRSSRTGTAAVHSIFATTTAALRNSPRRFGRVSGVPLKRARKASSLSMESNATKSSSCPAPYSGRNSCHFVSAAKRLNGQTSSCMSQSYIILSFIRNRYIEGIAELVCVRFNPQVHHFYECSTLVKGEFFKSLCDDV